MSFQADAFQNDAFQMEETTVDAYLLGTYVDWYGVEFCLAYLAVLTSFAM